MRSGQIAFIQDKTFQSDILREKMDKEKIPPMVAIVLCDDDPFTLQLLSELLERAIRQSKQRPTCLSGLCWSGAAPVYPQRWKLSLFSRL